MTRLFHPESSSQRAARDALLTRALRPEGTPFAIADEYPLVLSPTGVGFSYCLAADEALATIVAHANLWPRVLVGDDGAQVAVGLVGNVATDEQWRGRGLMTALLRGIEDKARADGLKALLLWSDLEEFYQKLGFRSCGKEYRLLLPVDQLPRERSCREVTDFRQLDLAALLNLRPTVGATLRRSPEEFAAQLSIPATTLVVSDHAWVAVGKGCDMQGVAHEWGGAWRDVLAVCKAAGEALGLAELLILSPDHQVGGVAHPVGWVKLLEQTPDSNASTLLERAFIWGLDSI